MDKKIESVIFNVADILRGPFSYEDYTNLCIYFVFIKYVIDNEKLPYDKDTFALQRMMYSGELDEEALINVSVTLEKQYEFPSSSLIDLVKSYVRVSQIERIKILTKDIMNIFMEVSFKNQKDEVVNGIINLLYSSAVSFGRIMGEKISKRSLSLLIKSIINVKDEDKFADLTYGFGISTLEITKGKQCEITGYEINRSSVAIGIILLVISEKDKFHIINKNVMHLTIGEESFDKIVTIPPLGMRVSDLRYEYNELFSKYNLPSHNYNLEIYMLLKSIEALKKKGEAVVTISSNILSSSTKAMKLLRKLLIENYLQSVIQLPALYYGTNTPTIVLILKKDKLSDIIQFINVSTNEFFLFSEKTIKNNTELTDSGIKKIIQIYQEKQSIEGISIAINREEIDKETYSLVLEKYIKVTEKREYVSNEEIDFRLKELYNELRKMMGD